MCSIPVATLHFAESFGQCMNIYDDFNILKHSTGVISIVCREIHCYGVVLEVQSFSYQFILGIVPENVYFLR